MGQQTGRPALGFIADDKALDFINSIAAPRGTEYDWLSNGKDLLAWLVASELITAEEADGLGHQIEDRALEGAAKKARELREWFRKIVLYRAGTKLGGVTEGDLKKLNEILAQASNFLALETGPVKTLQLTNRRRWGGADMLLVPIAEAMAKLIESVDFSEIKNCEGPTCTMMFRDISKNHKRRWCSMAVCGNRAKAAAHRKKIKSKENS